MCFDCAPPYCSGITKLVMLLCAAQKSYFLILANHVNVNVASISILIKLLIQTLCIRLEMMIDISSLKFYHLFTVLETVHS